MVSLLVEVPEDLHQLIQKYLDKNPDWNQDRVFQAALSLFLLQNEGDRAASSPNWGLHCFITKSQHAPDGCQSIARKAYTPSPNWGLQAPNWKLQAFDPKSQHEDEGLWDKDRDIPRDRATGF